jgi:hypothetical protein
LVGISNVRGVGAPIPRVPFGKNFLNVLKNRLGLLFVAIPEG